MNYDELKQVAQSHIRQNENLPSNSFLLLNQLHIPFKNEKQCAEDYGGKMNPLYNHPAFLLVDNKGNKTIYFNSATKYWNFYIFHEIAHYLLGHEDDCPQNEIDADMLACILAAPLENLPSTIKTARDLSVICQIPIDKAEVYWQEVKYKSHKHHTKLLFSGIFLFIFFTMIIKFSSVNKISTEHSNKPTDSAERNNTPMPSTSIEIQTSDTLSDMSYYITSSGTHYHKAGCQYIKHKTNTISITLEEAKLLGFDACDECISQ